MQVKKMGFLDSVLLFDILSITLLLYQSHLPILVVAAKDLLMPGDRITNFDNRTSSTLSSSNGIFTLGFFTIPSTSNVNFTYIGIWYTHEKEEGNKLFWVANRDTPVIGEGAILAIDDLGTLNILDRNGTTPFKLFDNSGSENNTRAMLEDSGNFRVYDANNRTIWQNIDHPTDTLIPGMKLGYNLTTLQNWTLTSWANNDAPTSGAFTMRFERYQNSPQILIYRHGQLYWASGPLNNGSTELDWSFRFLKAIPDMKMVSDASGMYMSITRLGASTLRLSPLGHFIDITQHITYTPDFCDGSDNAKGCMLSASESPSCRGRQYVWERGDWIGDYGNKDDNSSISLGDCMERCWNDCTCTGCTTLNSNGTGCITWGGPTNSISNNDESGLQGQKYIISASHKPPKKKIWLWILVSMASVIMSVLAYLGYVRIRRRVIKGKEIRRTDELIHQLTGSNSFNYGDELERGIRDSPHVKIFSLKAILAATNNFSDENKLGQGGYGPVYKGELSDGRKIAVKRLSKASGQGILEFKSELILISKLQHTNLVRLYGCCVHQEEKMLIYELMPNKSLDFFIFVDDNKEKIDWQIRFKIIEGIAQGLLYLHKYSRMRVIHRDLKVSNVLLDEKMNPKIADFGLARIFHHDVSEAMTKRVVGTFGYMAPEYAMHGTFSSKSDVYSFGVLTLEIVSGKKNSSSFHKYDMPLNLVGYAWELWKRETMLELKDEALGESYDMNQLIRAVHVGLLCVQENAKDRPNISEVISMLNNEITDLPIPKRPAFYINPDEVRESRSSRHLLGSNIHGSVNGMTNTTMEAR